jgi:creatinine amidohydrolase
VEPPLRWRVWRGTVSISARTLHQVITDAAASLSRSGVHRLVPVSGHGGNHVLDWTRARQDARMETSILLETYPEVVRPGNETADHTADERPHLLTLGMSEYTKQV